ncbi:MAG TPA: aminotransferase class III-fold pyridoxal phosphate-dependent enzyme [Ilumatobacteraceae bacterium]|nr:aminotransferase class III-fold pyridoxal phosphate-dependent enzyme [Ilumatobacteraceae bacterium]
MAGASELDRAVATARDAYTGARPRSAELAVRAAEVLPGGNTRSVLHFDPFPFRVASAEGKFLIDIDGHRYVDLLGNYTAGLLGHSPGAVRAAAHAAIDNGWTLGAVHPNEVRFAELLVARFPSIEQVRFTNSGTEANLMALALALHHTQRTKVVVFDGGYHGGVITFAGHREVNVPHQWVTATYNDIEGIGRVFDEIGSELAAVLVEPLQGSAGCIPADQEFLRALRRACDRSGVLLIFDEVMTSRLSPGGAQSVHNVMPDLTTLGKYLAGGFSFGAFGGRRELMAAFDSTTGGPLGHAGTFNNNVVSMAAGIATLTEVLTPQILAATNARGERLRETLNATFTRHGLPMCVTGSGSLMNIHATAGPVRSVDDLRSSNDAWKELLFFDALHAGFFIARRGFIALSIEITDDDVETFASFVDRWSADARALRESACA